MKKKLGIFEKFLSIWVLLCIITGGAIGKLFPTFSQFLSKLEYAHFILDGKHTLILNSPHIIHPSPCRALSIIYFKIIFQNFWKNPCQGSRAHYILATSEDVEDLSGKYFSERK